LFVLRWLLPTASSTTLRDFDRDKAWGEEVPHPFGQQMVECQEKIPIGHPGETTNVVHLPTTIMKNLFIFQLLGVLFYFLKTLNIQILFVYNS